MIDILEHFKRYPVVRLPDGNKYLFKDITLRKSEHVLGFFLSVKISGMYLSLNLGYSKEVSFSRLRYIRRELAVRSADQWRIR